MAPFAALKNPIANPTAGLIYHWRALRYRRLWQPFRQAVEGWLHDWIPPELSAKYSMLVLIGPSAGYTLPEPFVMQFANIVAVDPDPAAALLFQARFRRPVQWVFDDFFDLAAKRPSPQKLLSLFSVYPNAAFLFCNIIGQLPITLRERKGVDVENYMHELAVVMTQASTRFKMASC